MQAKQKALLLFSLPWVEFSSANNEGVELGISRLSSSIEILVCVLTSITLYTPLGYMI